MPHIQLTNGSRLFVDENDTIEELWMESAKTYTLEHVGFGALRGATAPTVTADKPWLRIRTLATVDNKQTFTITAGGMGKAKLVGRSSAGVTSEVLIVAGTVQNHFSPRSIDLLADVLRAGDPVKVLLILQMLYNRPDNIFNQKTQKNYHPKYGIMACGIVAKERGNQIFSKDPLTGVPQLGTPSDKPDVVCPIHYESPYHEPLQRHVRKRSDLKYKSDVIAAARKSFWRFLQAGRPVRVGVVDRPGALLLHKPRDPSRKGYDLYAYDDGGHTVLIFACNEDINEFAYIDPWAAGSVLKYYGGLSGDARPESCYSMGKFKSEYDPTRLAPGGKSPNENLLRQTRDTEWGFSTAADNFLEIISGP
jgi:hypothetical protein